MRRRGLWLAAGLVAIPVGGAWALAQESSTTPSGSSGAVMVAEQVSVARHVVPFAFSGDATAGTVWATGRTRAASTPEADKNAKPPDENAPASTLLVAGAIRGNDRPTAWGRAEPPIDRDGNALALGSWRLEDGITPATSVAATSTGDALHAGAGTSAGAAAVLVRIEEGGGSRAAVLARTADGRFHELPAPPVPLDGPAGAVTPMDVFDITLPAGSPAPPGNRGRTGVIAAPQGSSGAIVWDGAAWTVEPWQAADGTPLGARTALAIGSTDDGDAVALFGGNPTGPTADRVILARRDGVASAFRPVALTDAALLGGPLPTGVTAIAPVAAPGQPLTVGDRHWWVDVRVDRGPLSGVSATVHLAPGVGADRFKAQATGAWCQPELPVATGCTRPLGFAFPTVRGYRSEVFTDPASAGDAALPFGRRVITSPVIPEATGTAEARDASASGGYLELAGERFALRSGVGDDGKDGTQSAVVGRGAAVVLGGRRTVGRRMAARGGELAGFDASVPGPNEGIVDVQLSPPGAPALAAGALEVTSSGGALLQRAGDPWTLARSTGSAAVPGDGPRWVTAAAWDTPTRVLWAGRGGLVETGPPTPLSPFSFGEEPPGTLIDGTGDLDLLDVATRGAAGWAVGRDGAVVRRANGQWAKVPLPVSLAGATMMQVAFSGDEALISSDKGLLIGAPNGQLARDLQLAALLTEDGRSDAVVTVAALPDGTAVVDGRYIREAASGPWLRLASPAEGDTVALALWRVASTSDGVRVVQADGTVRETSFAVAASIADSPRPVYGPQLPLPDAGVGGGSTNFEGPPLVTDGRAAVLRADGWRDVVGVSLHASRGRDLARRSPPITSFAVDDAGDGWASGGVGSYLNFVNPASFPRESPSSIEFAMGNLRQTVPARAPLERAGEGPGAGGVREAGVRVFVGGHPACLDECAGREDQGLGPDENLREALRHVGDMSDPATGPTVVIVGGGRSGDGTAPSEAGLARYGELLQSTPGLTVAAVLGSGDAPNPVARRRFREAMAPFFLRSPAAGGVRPVTTPTAPVDDPASDAVAYAFDVPSRGVERAARVVVIDNAGGTLRGGPRGDQARWLTEVLTDAAQQGVRAIVVGAARLDEGNDRATDRAEQLALLVAGGVEVYVATEGTDDVQSPAFGARIAAQTLQVSGRTIRHIRSSALGHLASPFGGADSTTSPSPEAQRELSAGWSSVGLLALDVVPQQSVDASIVPVFDRVQANQILTERGRADFFAPSFFNGGGAGYRAVNPQNVAAGETDVRTFPFVDLLRPSFCRVFSGEGECASQLPIDATYRVADPSIATFVRARPPKGNGQAPEVVLDANGNPVVDPTAGLLCATGVGETTISVTVSGRTARFPLRVTEPQDSVPGRGKAPCAFSFGLSPVPPKAAPAPLAVVPAPVPPVVAEVPQPESKEKPKPNPKPVEKAKLQPASPTGVSPVPGVGVWTAPEAAPPPVTLKPKPTPPGPAPPPSGLAPSFQPNPQLQQVTSPATQKQREEELAREGAMQRAAAYERPSDPALVGTLVLGGVGLLLTAGAGGAVLGSRRRTANAAARAHGIVRR